MFRIIERNFIHVTSHDRATKLINKPSKKPKIDKNEKLN